MKCDGYVDDLLHEAARRGNVEQASQLISGGCDVNQFDDIGKTPLHYAVAAEDLKMVALLIAAGADVNARSESLIGDTPLADNAQRCSLEMARMLVDSGADPTIRGWMQLNALDRAGQRKRADGCEVYRFLETAAENRFRTQQHLAPYGSEARRRRR
jgi:ankyrin repeat protein